MEIKILKQPDEQLGRFISECIKEEQYCKKIIFISAFVSLKTILRLRDNLLNQKEYGAEIIFNVGIDLYGTSKNVLEELVQWNCNTWLTHNAYPRVTFHSKIYCIETEKEAHVVIGSNNLTEGGMFSNYETSTIVKFNLPIEEQEYQSYIEKIKDLINPQNSEVSKKLNIDLIEQLSKAGLIKNEKEARKYSEKNKQYGPGNRHTAFNNPFGTEPIKYPPLLEISLRKKLSKVSFDFTKEKFTSEESIPERILAWKKELTATDVLQVSGNTHHVGGVRLTQAKFEKCGQRIDHTQYFRQLFDDYDWEQIGGYYDQEHTFIPMRVRIGEEDFGINRFEIRYKPSGEAGQRNYTTQLLWGQLFSVKIRERKLKGWFLHIYETPYSEYDFFLDIQK